MTAEASLGKILVEGGVLTASALKAAVRLKERQGGSLAINLVLAGAVDDKTLAAFYEDRFQMARVTEDELEKVDRATFELIPVEIIFDCGVFPLRTEHSADPDGENDCLVVGVLDPFERSAVEEAAFFAAFDLSPRLMTIGQMTRHYLRLTGKRWKIDWETVLARRRIYQAARSHKGSRAGKIAEEVTEHTQKPRETPTLEPAPEQHSPDVLSDELKRVFQQTQELDERLDVLFNAASQDSAEDVSITVVSIDEDLSATEEIIELTRIKTPGTVKSGDSSARKRADGEPVSTDGALPRIAVSRNRGENRYYLDPVEVGEAEVGSSSSQYVQQGGLDSIVIDASISGVVEEGSLDEPAIRKSIKIDTSAVKREVEAADAKSIDRLDLFLDFDAEDDESEGFDIDIERVDGKNKARSTLVGADFARVHLKAEDESSDDNGSSMEVVVDLPTDPSDPVEISEESDEPVTARFPVLTPAQLQAQKDALRLQNLSLDVEELDHDELEAGWVLNDIPLSGIDFSLNSNSNSDSLDDEAFVLETGVFSMDDEAPVVIAAHLEPLSMMEEENVSISESGHDAEQEPESESIFEVEPESDLSFEIDVKSGLKFEPDHALEVAYESEPGFVHEAGIKVKPETESGDNVGATLEPEAGPSREVGTETSLEAEFSREAGAEAKSEPELSLEADVEAKSEPEVDQKVDVEVKPEPEVGKKVEVAAKPETGAGQKVDVEAKPEPEVGQKVDAGVKPLPDVEAPLIVESKQELLPPTDDGEDLTQHADDKPGQHSIDETPVIEPEPKPTPKPAKKSAIPLQVVAASAGLMFKLKPWSQHVPDRLLDGVALMQGVRERDDVGVAALTCLRELYKRVVLFSVRGQSVSVWMAVVGASGTVVKPRLSIPIATIDCLRRPVRESASYLGALLTEPTALMDKPTREGIEQLVDILGEDGLPMSVVVTPVMVKGRPIVLMYCDNGAEKAVTIDREGLALVRHQMESALERVILMRKHTNSAEVPHLEKPK